MKYMAPIQANRFDTCQTCIFSKQHQTSSLETYKSGGAASAKLDYKVHGKEEGRDPLCVWEGDEEKEGRWPWQEPHHHHLI